VLDKPRMSRAVRFIVLLVLGLGILTFGATVIAERTARSWFKQDLNLRARLAITGARSALVDNWQDGAPTLSALLNELTADERLLAASACSLEGQTLAQTALFPPELTCTELLGRRATTDHAPDAEGFWSEVETLPSGQVHVSVVPVNDQDQTLGYAVLVQDLAFVELREARTRRYVLIASGILALLAAGITIAVARYVWRELMERIDAEREAGRERNAWNAERLRQVLQRELDGGQVVVLANREPYIHLKGQDGKVEVQHPASGLVTALEPVLRACSGTWIAHGSGSADREMADRHGRLGVPPEQPDYWLRRVWLSPEEEKGYYYGFSNEGLWPLCHIAHARPIFRIEDWQHYRAVNEKFAAAVVEEASSADPIVLVQDYHFALAPRLIRERLPRATILMFWHIPWTNAEQFGICPWRTELLEGMLGASILGFHTQFHCNNFLDSVDRFLEARIDREQNAVFQRGQCTLVRPYPISIEWPARWSYEAPDVQTCRESVRAELGLAPDALLGIGVDRLDYTKGIEERLLAVERLLENEPSFVGRFTFVQVAAPSRQAIERYSQLNETVEAVAARINQRFKTDTWRPIVLLRSHHEPPVVFRFYRAADLCFVSSLHDGMNLVAKEFVCARTDERGVLILSQFTGASRELTEALIVNPYNLEESSAALRAALTMSSKEQSQRMRIMRSYLAEFNVYRWAGRMLMDAARLRQRERVNKVLGVSNVPRKAASL
jgi:trehalose 6-phosphate synthase